MMRVYLTKDVCRTGKITEAEGTVLTGHLDRIQVNGISSHRLDRVVHKPHWHETMEEAQTEVQGSLQRMIEGLERSMSRTPNGSTRRGSGW
jgi:hypothetical protein